MTKEEAAKLADQVRRMKAGTKIKVGNSVLIKSGEKDDNGIPIWRAQPKRKVKSLGPKTSVRPKSRPTVAQQEKEAEDFKMVLQKKAWDELQKSKIQKTTLLASRK
jgi:hypothetical protein|tara:strand:- start:328 stop:645 length:318 start_codon:yes stop_codon:yes gene_type:complete